MLCSQKIFKTLIDIYNSFQTLNLIRHLKSNLVAHTAADAAAANAHHVADIQSQPEPLTPFKFFLNL